MRVRERRERREGERESRRQQIGLEGQVIEAQLEKDKRRRNKLRSKLQLYLPLPPASSRPLPLPSPSSLSDPTSHRSFAAPAQKDITYANDENNKDPSRVRNLIQCNLVRGRGWPAYLGMMLFSPSISINQPRPCCRHRLCGCSELGCVVSSRCSHFAISSKVH